MRIQVKLVSRMEFDLLRSGKINFVDTFLKTEFEIGESIYLRCYYWDSIVDDYRQILVTVESVTVLSYNTLINRRLYRVEFSNI